MGYVIVFVSLGLLLLLAEILIIPGLGVAGILGILSLVASCIFSFKLFGAEMGYIIVAVNIALVIGLTIYVLRAKTWKRFTLNEKIEGSVASEMPKLMVGDEGVTITRLAPKGSARFASGVYEVKALEGLLGSGIEVRVVLIEDNTVIVKPIC